MYLARNCCCRIVADIVLRAGCFGGTSESDDCLGIQEAGAKRAQLMSRGEHSVIRADCYNGNRIVSHPSQQNGSALATYDDANYGALANWTHVPTARRPSASDGLGEAGCSASYARSIMPSGEANAVLTGRT